MIVVLLFKLSTAVVVERFRSSLVNYVVWYGPQENRRRTVFGFKYGMVR